MSRLAPAVIGAVAVVLAVVTTVTPGAANGRTVRYATTTNQVISARTAITSSGKDVDQILHLAHGDEVDSFYRTGEKDVPWVVYVHGGYWEFGSSNTTTLRSWGATERKHGFAAFSVSYRFVPGVSWPTPEDDVIADITWIRAHARSLGLDPHKGFIIGQSAGGLLATVAALHTGWFAGAVSSSGAVDPLWAYEHSTNATLRRAAYLLLGSRSPSKAAAAWQSARMAHYIGKHVLPMLFMQSVGDPIVSFTMTVDAVAALRAHHYPVTEIKVPGTVHVLQSAADFARINSWIAKVLGARPTARAGLRLRSGPG